MDEDSFTKRFPSRFLYLMFTSAFFLAFFAFTLPGKGDTIHLPSNGQVDEEREPRKEKRKDVLITRTEVNSTTRKVDTVTPHSTPDTLDRSANVVVSLRLGKKSKPFHPIIVKAASRYEVDPDLIKAVIMAESGYNPQAISSQGAKGLMQLMPKTAEALGVEDTFNPEHNVNGGVKYLKQLLEEFDHDIKLALAAYNAGSSKVRRHRGIPPIKATRYYVKKVFEYYQYFKNETAGETDSA